MDLSSAAPPSIRHDAPGFDPNSASSLPWIWGNAGVANSILDGHKTVEIRFRNKRLLSQNGAGPLLRELRPGSRFVYRERVDGVLVALVLRVTSTPFSKHPSRGHAVETHKSSAVPESLIQQFSSDYPKYSAAWGNQFYDSTFAVQNGGSPGRRAVAVPFAFVGQIVPSIEDSDPLDVSLAAEADIDDSRTDINWERLSRKLLARAAASKPSQLSAADSKPSQLSRDTARYPTRRVLRRTLASAASVFQRYWRARQSAREERRRAALSPPSPWTPPPSSPPPASKQLEYEVLPKGILDPSPAPPF